jgi:carbon-monoxide dehydrogenase large subunit
VKGGSETGTIGAPAAIGNAIVDALWHLGVRHIDPPYSSHAVWKALQKSGTDHVLRRGIKETVVCP